MLRNLLMGGVAGVCVLLASCSFGESEQRAETCVARFHEMLDGEQYHEIYAQGDTGFQGSASEAEVTKFLGTVHRKLGAVKSYSVAGYRVNHQLFGSSTVALTCSTEFAGGPGTEAFTLVLDGARCELRGYNITSRALVSD